MLGEFGEDEDWYATRVLYAYLHPTRQQILFIGKADMNTTVRKRWTYSGKKGFWDYFNNKLKVKKHTVLIRDKYFEGNFSSNLLGSVDKLLIFVEDPPGNIQSTKSCITRSDLEVKCTGSWSGKKYTIPRSFKMDNYTYSVKISPDKEGYTGRECPECENYFKVKGGTGLPTTSCICPYCKHTAESNHFFTKEQIEYAQSVALNQMCDEAVTPMLKKFQKSLQSISFKSDFISLDVKTGPLPKFNVETRYYSEKDLETKITCDNCGLEFVIYGVFANCPDCGKLNALIILKETLSLAKRKINIFKTANDEIIKIEILIDVLGNCVSAFDAFGKAIISEKPMLYRSNTRNLFQKITLLSEDLKSFQNIDLELLLGKEILDFIKKMFQVRHIYEHNMGVIDKDFIKRIPGYDEMMGRKYNLKQEEVLDLIKYILLIGEQIEATQYGNK